MMNINTFLRSSRKSYIEEKEMVMILFDISGYTKFMATNNSPHIHFVIQIILNNLANQIKKPFKLIKFEGDALFISGEAKKLNKEIVERQVNILRETFENLKKTFTVTSKCECEICREVSGLKSKVFAHHGSVAVFNINGSYDLNGVPVIELHRLTKNKLKTRDYILYTKSLTDIFPIRLKNFINHCMNYEYLEPIEVRVLNLE